MAEPFVVLHYTGLCNARCAHCIVESGPSRRDRIDEAVAAAAIRGASRVAGMRMVVFSGGESFVYLPEVLALCRQAKTEGLRTRIISNGYWARGPEVAARMLERLADGSVDQLVISFDEFHVPFIAAERVRNIVAGAAQAARSPWVVYSAVLMPDAVSGVPKAGRGWPAPVLDLLHLYGLDPERAISLQDVEAALDDLVGEQRETFKEALKRERIIISWQPLAVGGRATRELSERVAVRSIEDEPGTPCEVAGRQITVPTNGRAYPCCSLWTNFDEHHFGTVGDPDAFGEAYRRIQDDPLVQFIHDVGPGPLIRWLRRRGYGLREEYTDICNMCEEILSRCSLDTLRAEVAGCRQELFLSTLLGPLEAPLDGSDPTGVRGQVGRGEIRGAS